MSFPRRRESSKMLSMYYVYILASKKNGTLYTGVTNNLERRAYEHRCGLIEGFTKKYNIKNLVYFETTNDINSAILRVWKIRLIEQDNPSWDDLSKDWIPACAGMT
jgi:putative endonuclease